MQNLEIKMNMSVFMQDFVTEDQIKNHLEEFGIEVKHLKIKEQHRSAYGLKPYQIIEIDKDSGEKYLSI